MKDQKAQAFGVAIAVTAIGAIVGFILFGGHVGPYGRLFGLTETERPSLWGLRSPEEEEAAPAGSVFGGNGEDFSLILLHTHQARKDIAENCTPGTDVEDRSVPHATITLRYPRICDAIFDGTVAYVADTLAERFADIAQREASGSRPYLLSLQADSLYVNDVLASALLAVSVDTGGAHGTVELYSVNVDRARGIRLSLEDLFAPRSGYLSMLSERAGQALAQKLGPEAVSHEGVAPREHNFLVFTLDDRAISFHFPPYQVAAYAAGPQSVTIPYAELGRYWRTN